MVPEAGAYFGRKIAGISFSEKEGNRFVSTAVDRCSPRSQDSTGSYQSPTARGYVSYGNKRMSGSAMDQGA